MSPKHTAAALRDFVLTLALIGFLGLMALAYHWLWVHAPIVLAIWVLAGIPCFLLVMACFHSGGEKRA